MGAWERVIVAVDYDVWQTRDAEGHRRYAYTPRRDGVSVEPTGTQALYSLADVHEVARQDIRRDDRR